MRKLLFCLALVCICIIPLQVSGIGNPSKHTAVAQEPASITEAWDAAPSSPAYINKIYTMDGVTYVTVDYIQWYEGKAADRIFREREKDADLTEAPDGYYIVNDDPKTYTLPVEDSAKVLMQIYNRSGSWDDADIVKDEPITVSKLRSLFSGSNLESMKNYPYHITVVNGKVVKLVQQFIP